MIVAIAALIDLMPIFFPIAVGQTKTLSLDLASCSLSLRDPALVAVERVSTDARATRVVLRGKAKGRTNLVLVCGDRVRQDVSIEIR